MAALAVVPKTTLYDLIDRLAILLEALEDSESDEQRAQIEADIREIVSQEVRKVDGIAKMLAHFKTQAQFAKDEIDRLRERKAAFEHSEEKLKQYVIDLMEGFQVKKLEGQTSTFSLRACPASVEVSDESQIPDHLKAASVKCSAALWNEIREALDPDFTTVIDQSATVETSPDKRAIKFAFEHGEPVPGCDLLTRNTLIRK